MQDISSYFGIGIERPKHSMNIGTLWRTASILGASFIFTVGDRYTRQITDTENAWKKIPLYTYKDIEQMRTMLPYSSMLVGVELDDKAVDIITFKHPPRCTYLLGAEDIGLSAEAISACHHLVQLPGERCLNVAVAGSMVIYDRIAKGDDWAW